MDKLMRQFRCFVRDEEGAQIVEYALIIAAVSLLLILSLQALNSGDFTTFVNKVGTCLTSAVCT